MRVQSRHLSSVSPLAAGAVAAKLAIDGKSAPAIVGSKPMVIRFQKEPPSSSPNSPHRSKGSAVSEPASPTADLYASREAGQPQRRHSAPSSEPGALAAVSAHAHGPEAGAGALDPLETAETATARSSPTSGLDSSCSEAEGAGTARAKTSMLPAAEDDPHPEPAINLSNRLNPNNVHFDKELAARCVWVLTGGAACGCNVCLDEASEAGLCALSHHLCACETALLNQPASLPCSPATYLSVAYSQVQENDQG